VVLHYGFMALVSITAVGAFDAVGAILVVALMIAPPAAAYMLTDRLGPMIALAVCIGAGSAITGYWLAYLLDASIAGAMATMAGVWFALTFLFAPGRGLVAIARRRRRQRYGFAQTMLTIHLLHHEGQPDELVECRIAHLSEHLRWPDRFATRVVELAERAGLVHDRGDGALFLTPSGRQRAQEAMTR
jgi:manganese/zinc/iron transport system permease protein